ncbi:OsmC family protein [Halomonas sp. ML-15]|uniref:OsmC family protein n=1 Tax=Halomonas sp. ML-15 TaxID=2773305 RepID=UPI001746379A|nr:OsmC family protein [Halomonas sp. ML-15]MBD3898333.1 OsmC family protein [Halomonas sp. ML-15]
MSITNKASAHWQGDLKTGQGSVSTASGSLAKTPYGFKNRFEGEPGTNPEELIGAAHASCYSMALSMILGEAGFTADSIDTQATVKLDQDDSGFSITAIHLETTAKIPGADDAAFQDAANKAKAGCPISKLFNAEITLEAKLAN